MGFSSIKQIFCWSATCVTGQQNLKRKRDKMAVEEKNQLNVLVDLVKNKWGDNAVEAFAGLLSTVVTERQIEFLIEDLRGEI